MEQAPSRDSFGTACRLATMGGEVRYFRLGALTERGVCDVERLPRSVRVLLEALLRGEDGEDVTREDVLRLATWKPQPRGTFELPFRPGRVLLQDFTGVPCVVDLAALREALARAGADPGRVQPRVPVDLVIDHSIQVDVHAVPDAADRNAALELERNRERFALLRWASRAFRGLRVVPPARGICHQVNLEYLATVVDVRRCGGEATAFPDTLVGTDSHTPTVNGLGVLGWGVGGIEAEAVMLGRPLYLPAPDVLGVRLTGALPEGATATDLVLTLTEWLRARGVVGRFVEFCGPGLDGLSVPDRATVANMAPEYGATAGYFPVDTRTLEYLRLTGRSLEQVELVERYCRAQGLFREAGEEEPEFGERGEFDLGDVRPSVAGPARPDHRIGLPEMRRRWREALAAPAEGGGFGVDRPELRVPVRLSGTHDGTVELGHGAVAIAAITSCTNTSNPAAMVAAGLLARRAVEAGLRPRPWVKTSLAPGSRVVTDYLRDAGLLDHLERLGFHVVGYGCTTCIGNSGPLPAAVGEAAERDGVVLAAVLSGNRNFPGRIHPQVRASFLASPPLVVAYALAGSLDVDLATEPLGRQPDGTPVRLADLWPSAAEIDAVVRTAVSAARFRERYAALEEADEGWNRLAVPDGERFPWDATSTYVREPPFVLDVPRVPPPARAVHDARVLVLLGDGVTTDHISPAGPIPADGPAGRLLLEAGVPPGRLHSFGGRRGNHEVMLRGTFANPRLRNALVPGVEGGWTVHLPSGERVTIHEAAERYRAAGTPTLVVAGRDYGMGSSRDWAAKGTRLLGVVAVLARSFERIHRGNLLGMGVLPLQFRDGESASSLGLSGRERYSIALDDRLAPGAELEVVVRDDGGERRLRVHCRLDSPGELDTWRQGGILPAVLRRLIAEDERPR